MPCLQLHGDARCAKLNSVIHVVGMLSLVPDFAAESPFDESRELATPPIPTSLVRLQTPSARFQAAYGQSGLEVPCNDATLEISMQLV